MAGAGKKWLLGCGIGCAAILLVLVGIGVFGTLWVRDTFRGFDHAVEGRAELEQRFGRVNEFTPWPDGTIPAERIEAFLAVRDATGPARRAMAERFSAIPMSESEARDLEAQPAAEKARSILGIVGSALGIGAEMGRFFEARNSALLAQEMGMGEYSYLYVLSYYTFLQRSPGDGPGSERDADDSIDISFGDVASRRRVHDALLAMLRNQLHALPEPVVEERRQALQAEIEAMKGDRRRYPWRDGLPEETTASLEPFRERLAASYDPVSNPFELAINTKKGLSITAE